MWELPFSPICCSCWQLSLHWQVCFYVLVVVAPCPSQCSLAGIVKHDRPGCIQIPRLSGQLQRCGLGIYFTLGGKSSVVLQLPALLLGMHITTRHALSLVARRLRAVPTITHHLPLLWLVAACFSQHGPCASFRAGSTSGKQRDSTECSQVSHVYHSTVCKQRRQFGLLGQQRKRQVSYSVHPTKAQPVFMHFHNAVALAIRWRLHHTRQHQVVNASLRAATRRVSRLCVLSGLAIRSSMPHAHTSTATKSYMRHMSRVQTGHLLLLTSSIAYPFWCAWPAMVATTTPDARSTRSTSSKFQIKHAGGQESGMQGRWLNTSTRWPQAAAALHSCSIQAS